MEIARAQDELESSVGHRDEWGQRNGRRLDEEEDKKKIGRQQNKKEIKEYGHQYFLYLEKLFIQMFYQKHFQFCGALELFLMPKLNKLLYVSTNEGRYKIEPNKPWKVTVENGISEKMHIINLMVGPNLFI
jgi:hypothetical protein